MSVDAVETSAWSSSGGCGTGRRGGMLCRRFPPNVVEETIRSMIVRRRTAQDGRVRLDSMNKSSTTRRFSLVRKESDNGQGLVLASSADTSKTPARVVVYRGHFESTESGRVVVLERVIVAESVELEERRRRRGSCHLERT